MSTPILRYVRTDKLSIATAASATSAITNASHPILLAVVSDVAFHAVVGDTDATSDDAYFPAAEIHLIPLPAGAELAIRGAATGSAWVSEVSRS